MGVPSPCRYLRSNLVGVGSVVMSVGLVAVLVTGTIGRKGHASSRVNLSTGSAWFPSPDVGTVALIDGTTVTRVAQVAVSAPGAPIEAVQTASSSYALDHSSGQVVRVDGATLKAASPVRLGAANDEHLAIRSTGKVTWAVERGGTIAQQLDPVTLVPVGPALAFPGNAAAPVLGSDGTLWLVDGGLLRSLRGARVRTSVQLPQVGASQLVMASGHPVVLDSTTHRAIEINAGSGHPMHQACFDNADASALVSGSNSRSPLALAVSPKAGTLMISDLNGGGCKTVVLGDASDTDRYGEAVEADGLVYVPDYAAGTVIVIDSRTGTVAGRPFVDADAGYHFKLLAYHGFVWFDDDHVDTAGIVTLNGAKAVSTSGGDTQGKSLQSRDRAASPSSVTTTPGSSVSGPPRQGQPGSPGIGVPGTGLPGTGSPGGAPRGTGPLVTAPPAPTFMFTPNPGVVGQPVTFQDTTSGPRTVIGWTFATGNPATSSAPSTTVTWSAPGTFTVTLTVARPGLGAQSASRQVQITPPGNVTVPDVTRMTVAQAAATLHAAKLAAGAQSTVDSFVLRGDVASTTPSARTSVPQGTTVTLGVSDETGPISSFAGDGTPGCGGGAGSPGFTRSTVVATPARLTIDSAGNMYIAEWCGGIVAKVNAGGGFPQIFTVAGIAGSCRCNSATTANLNGPIATAVDGAGNLYVAEAPSSGGGDIRKVDPSGNITTLTNFTSPWDLKFGPGGLLYVAGRFGNCSIDSVNTSTGTLTPVVGTPGACSDSATTLSDPASVSFDSSGAMYIAEPHAGVIRKFQGGSLTTVTGTIGSTGFSGDGRPATSAFLADPDDVAVDSLGDLFINDGGNLRVREVTTDGTINTVAGTGIGPYNGDGKPATQANLSNGGNGTLAGGLAIDGADHLFISDTNNNRVREIT